MASGPITPWQIDGETMETVRDFIFLGSKIIAVMATMKFKKCLLLGRKSVTQGDCKLKSRDIISQKGLSSKSYGFSCSHVWM